MRDIRSDMLMSRGSLFGRRRATSPKKDKLLVGLDLGTAEPLCKLTRLKIAPIVKHVSGALKVAPERKHRISRHRSAAEMYLAAENVRGGDKRASGFKCFNRKHSPIVLFEGRIFLFLIEPATQAVAGERRNNRRNGSGWSRCRGWGWDY